LRFTSLDNVSVLQDVIVSRKPNADLTFFDTFNNVSILMVGDPPMNISLSVLLCI
jgi:hypothetical protein